MNAHAVQQQFRHVDLAAEDSQQAVTAAHSAGFEERRRTLTDLQPGQLDA